MITQKTTYYEDYTIKTFSEFSGDVLVHYQKFNDKGKIIYEKIIDNCEKNYEYDSKGRVKRIKTIDNAKNLSWKTFSYTKYTMTILERCAGNPPQIYKTVFGPIDEKGERLMINQTFL